MESSEEKRPPSIIRQIIPAMVLSFIVSPPIGIFGSLLIAAVDLFTRHGLVNGENLLVMFPMICILGCLAGFTLGPLGGLIGTLIAIKTNNEEKKIIYSLLGTTVMLISWLVFLAV